MLHGQDVVQASGYPDGVVGHELTPIDPALEEAGQELGHLLPGLAQRLGHRGETAGSAHAQPHDVAVLLHEGGDSPQHPHQHLGGAALQMAIEQGAQSGERVEVAHHGNQQVFLGGIVVVEQARRDSGLTGDVLGRGALQAPLGEEAGRHFHTLLASELALASPGSPHVGQVRTHGEGSGVTASSGGLAGGRSTGTRSSELPSRRKSGPGGSTGNSPEMARFQETAAPR